MSLGFDRAGEVMMKISSGFQFLLAEFNVQVGRGGVLWFMILLRNYKARSAALLNGHSHYFESDFFMICTDADGPAPLELPNQWLWDIIDEFIYQVSGQLLAYFEITGPSKE